MCIAFLPFSVSPISEYGSQKIALAIYLANLGIAGLLLTALLGYAMRRKLTDLAFDNHTVTITFTGTLTLPVFCFVAFVLTLWSPYGWVLALLLMTPFRIGLMRLAARYLMVEQKR